jgi:hypothetical protein
MDPQFIGKEGQRLSGHVWCFGSDLRMPVLLSISWCCDGDGQGKQGKKKRARSILLSRLAYFLS